MDREGGEGASAGGLGPSLLVLRRLVVLGGELRSPTEPDQGLLSAIELLQQEEVDLLITDLVMPRVSGIDLIEKVRMVDADMPIIALTGYTDIFEANDTLDVDVIRGKPLSIKGLVDDMERLLEASDEGTSGV